MSLIASLWEVPTTFGHVLELRLKVYLMRGKVNGHKNVVVIIIRFIQSRVCSDCIGDVIVMSEVKLEK